MKRFLLLCSLAVTLSPALLSQTNPIPNPGFETWTSGNPNGWTTNNIPGTLTTITQSADSRSGSSAAQGTVGTYLSAMMTPLLITECQVANRYGSLTGYYKYTSTGGDSLTIAVIMYKNGSIIGAGIFETAVNASAYTQFVATIEYATGDVPDTAFIDILITSSTDVHVGSVFKVDDLAFGAVTSIESEENVAPSGFVLEQNYPNPFNPSTKVEFQVPQRGFVSLKIYDNLGREVATLVNEELEAGAYRKIFNADGLPSGTYIYRLVSAGLVRTGKMMVLK